ncbi:MAG: PD-(D/E)XK nuclease family protein [Fusobacteriaceae bacterium]|nr:PD-(D/E)XK nuclease family protein [Fusobacteriaceae bacterium]MBP9510164.1 PD-(D/E)XK nuclease family protein [Fusobacteriaceae bacterium]
MLDENKINFNIFTILRNESDEVNLHSKFIGEILKNKNYGKIFLEKFLENTELKFEEKKLKSYEIKIEQAVENYGRIDIVIELNFENASSEVIVIENKIYAEDQPEQLKRYFEAMNKKYSKKEIKILYLTLDGRGPSEQSYNGLELEEIKLISYKENIFQWIGECIKEVSTIPIIRETLVQYSALIEKITCKENEGAIKEMKNLIMGNEKYLKAAYIVPEVLKNIKIELHLKFWETL